MTKYLVWHPGGNKIILKFAGKNATDGFYYRDHSPNAKRILESFIVGKAVKKKTIKPKPRKDEDPDDKYNKKGKGNKAGLINILTDPTNIIILAVIFMLLFCWHYLSK